MTKRNPVDAELRRLTAEHHYGELRNVRRLSPGLAAGVIQTGCRTLICRRLRTGECVLLWSASWLPLPQLLKLQHAGYPT